MPSEDSRRLSWREIKEGTPGILHIDEGGKRTAYFELGGGETGAVDVFEGEGFSAKTYLIHPNLFRIE